jgi:hypothetical protein
MPLKKIGLHGVKEKLMLQMFGIILMLVRPKNAGLTTNA